MVRKRAVDSIVSMTEAGDENIISKVALILESYSKDIRDCTLQVILEVACGSAPLQNVPQVLLMCKHGM